MKKHLIYSVGLCVIFFASTAPGAQNYHVTVEHNVAATMRDGIVLYADVYRPDAPGKFPVLLERTPYNKEYGVDFGLKAAARGYVFIIQDVRGRFTSEGEWVPFKHESNDGYDTIEWAATLPYSDGKVGMTGGSYVGATQMLAAIASPPHLAGIFPFVTASNYHSNWTYQGGAFEQWFNESWTSGLAENTLDRQMGAQTNAMLWVDKLPLAEYPLLATGPIEPLAPYFHDWLNHPRYDDYWKQWSIEDHYSKIKVPVYSVGAWYDIFLGGTLRNYEGIKARGGNDAARNGQRLMVVIGGHSGGGEKIGEVDFGKQANFDLDDIVLRWYDHLLKGEANGVEKEKPVRIFVMGKNEWRDEDAWPPPGAHAVNFYLHSQGSANSLSGNGTLSETESEPAPAERFSNDQYVDDPSDPVPTVGGPLCCDGGHLAPGPRDQRPVEARQDVLVYSTPAFESDFEATGPVHLDLYASSSAVDTDFTAKLVDVWPNGFAQNLTEGILRARYRNSDERAEFMNPGKIYKLTIDLWATSNVFLKGHKLRLEISSSNFPRFDRNPNTGDEPEKASRLAKATNIVYHDAAHPSALVLDVVGR